MLIEIRGIPPFSQRTRKGWGTELGWGRGLNSARELDGVR